MQMFKYAYLLTFLFCIVACGGGGGSNDSSSDGSGGGSGGSTNQAPTVDAGEDKVVSANSTVILSAIAGDTDGVIASYNWAQTSGPTVQLNNSNTTDASFVAPELSEQVKLTFSIQVIDDDGASASDAITITVNASDDDSEGNKAPTIAMPDGFSVTEGGEVEITALVSDEDGEISSLLWSQLKGGAVAFLGQGTNTVSFSAPYVDTNTELTFSLEVTDNLGASSNAQITILVVAEMVNYGTNNLNDTGVTQCADRLESFIACPVSGFPNQDAEIGRDNQAQQGLLVKKGSGPAGFDFTKVSFVGEELSPSADLWSCINDNYTGLTWMIKSSSGVFSGDNTYSWFSTDTSTNGGEQGFENVGDCEGSSCDTQGILSLARQEVVCGKSQWRLPNRSELRGLFDYSIYSGFVSPTPKLSADFFPNFGNGEYWTSASSVSVSGNAWIIDINSGHEQTRPKASALKVLLVAGE